MLLNLEQNRRKNMISLTPLIDVVFILLLFFMLSSTFSRWYQIPLQTPASSNSQTADLTVLKIQSNKGEVRINGNTVDINNSDELQSMVQQYSKQTLVLTAAEVITVQTIVSVMDALKQNGARHISFAGTEK
jgi:biopolymer transport protein ExbD